MQEALRDLVHSTTTLSERELLKASEEQQRVARKLQERLVEHESQQKLWDMAMEEANDMHEALKLQLREQEERSEIKLELVTKQVYKSLHVDESYSMSLCAFLSPMNQSFHLR